MKYMTVLMTIIGSLTLSNVIWAQPASSLTPKELDNFCNNNPIWAAFAIEPATCLTVATSCAQKSEFLGIDAKVLSEGFYHCVFKQLGIEVD